jgi:hypothetical protein
MLLPELRRILFIATNVYDNVNCYDSPNREWEAPPRFLLSSFLAPTSPRPSAHTTRMTTILHSLSLSSLCVRVKSKRTLAGGRDRLEPNKTKAILQYRLSIRYSSTESTIINSSSTTSFLIILWENGSVSNRAEFSAFPSHARLGLKAVMAWELGGREETHWEIFPGHLLTVQLSDTWRYPQNI